MDTKMLIASIKSTLALKDIKNKSKKESLQKVLEKLKKRKLSVMKSIEKSMDKKQYQEDLDIISLHIKKGEKLLHDLSSKKVV